MKRNTVHQRATNMKHCRRLVCVLTDQQQLLCQQLSYSHKSRKRKGTQLKPRSQQIIARAKTDLTLQNCTRWVFGIKSLRLFCALNQKAETWGRIVTFCCNVYRFPTHLRWKASKQVWTVKKEVYTAVISWSCSSFNGLNWNSCSSTMVCIYVKVEELHSHVKLRTCLIRWRWGSVEWVLGESNIIDYLWLAKLPTHP